MKRATKNRPVSKLSPAELDAMSGEFDRELVADTFGPPPPSVRARLARARRKPGRPRVGAGSKAISVTIEKDLLRRIDRIARRRKTTRARLIAHGLRRVIQEEEVAAVP
jgi:hypothetical protein